MFPSPKYRQCTSDLKRGPIERTIRQICRETGRNIVVNCMGIRAQESASRAKLATFKRNDANSKAGREWYDWLPIHEMTTAEVFRTIAAAGQEPHWAYQAGMTRLSCCFCIMASRSDLATAARLQPDLYRRYVETERRLDSTMMMPQGGHRQFLDEIVAAAEKGSNQLTLKW
jgi:3'-phosphoadenosine 5'-phosphosulfate sulfotransferase (PAPS reductase)/FAD synthetase